MSYLILDKLFQNTLLIAVALKISKSSKFDNVFTILRLFKSFLITFNKFIRGAPLRPLNPLPLPSVKIQNFNARNAGVSSSYRNTCPNIFHLAA